MPVQSAMPLTADVSISSKTDSSNIDIRERKVALQFEEILVRQLLEPLEKSLSKSMGGDGATPMIGGMIISGLSQSISEGGGLGLARVIEEALRDPPAKPGFSSEGNKFGAVVKDG